MGIDGRAGDVVCLVAGNEVGLLIIFRQLRSRAIFDFLVDIRLGGKAAIKLIPIAINGFDCLWPPLRSDWLHFQSLVTCSKLPFFKLRHIRNMVHFYMWRDMT